MNKGNTTFNVIDGALPAGTVAGYDKGTKTMNIEVEWLDSRAFIAQGVDRTIRVCPEGFKKQLQFWNDAGTITVPVNDETKATYLANVMLHETAHVVLDRAWFRQWMGLRDHTSGGLMGGPPWGDNMSFSVASQSILDFDDGTKAELRAALGYKWAWY